MAGVKRAKPAGPSTAASVRPFGLKATAFTVFSPPTSNNRNARERLTQGVVAFEWRTAARRLDQQQRGQFVLLRLLVANQGGLGGQLPAERNRPLAFGFLPALLGDIPLLLRVLALLLGDARLLNRTIGGQH